MPISDQERERHRHIVNSFSTPGVSSSILEMFRKGTQERVLLLCFAITANGRTDHIPYAELLSGNPRDLYDPPEGVEERDDSIPSPSTEFPIS